LTTVFRAVVSAPLDELVARTARFREFQLNQNAVLREFLDIFAVDACHIDTWLIDGSEVF
jgi:hypothetical protein